MVSIGPAKLSNEAVRCIYIETILLGAMIIVMKNVKKKITLEPQFEIVGDEATGRVDYAINKIINTKEIICVIKGVKQSQEMLGIMQNTMQLDSSYCTNKKRKATEAFSDDDFDYLYGIVSTGEIFDFLITVFSNTWWRY